MFELPPEIIHSVCQHCEIRDIRALRQVSTAIKVIADEYMLRSLRFTFDRQDLVNMATLINNNPYAARKLPEIHFQADRLPIVACQEEWELCRLKTICDEAIWRGELQCAERRTYEQPENSMELSSREATRYKILQRETSKYSQEEMNQAWTCYKEMMQDQQAMDRAEEVFHCMTKIFKASQRLETVTLTLKDRIRDDPLRWRRNEFYQRGMVRPWGDDGCWSPNTRVLNQILLAAHTTGTKLRKLNVMPLSYQFFRQEASLMEKLHDTIMGLRHVHIQINSNFGIDHEEELAQRSTGIDHQSRPFSSSLRASQTRITAASEAARVIDALNDSRVYDLLSKASDLEHLLFHGPETDTGLPKMKLNAIVGSCPWPKLRLLCLTTFECTETELVKLVDNCRQSVACFCLADVLLTEGDWQNCFRRMAGRFPKGVDIVLKGRFGSRQTNQEILVCDPGHPFTHELIRYLETGQDEPKAWLATPWVTL
ncbi:hypothetical protein CERZMDRAFT_80390 [Cercospora zeae-maydis SCOH1-5]|uniref:F-box domain-containing protein n=1 Tax=Cercospora zeae-maydis SCOH1-5 TaxID=717836 RepID=A0A6A6FWR1_9PEZI|nr:hypothetical protein CERZMDRAFT_80390 [Cercospora zeae-maydis SCOH1-5]